VEIEAAADEDCAAEDLEAEERDEVLSKSRMSAVSKHSRRSTLTSKTYISNLEKQLE